MITESSFQIKSIPFDENYHPSTDTRLTTNFANLARGDNRQENLRNVLRMINNRFNDLHIGITPRPTAILLRSILFLWGSISTMAAQTVFFP